MLCAWNEWKMRCRLDACAQDTQRYLRAFARSRFRRFSKHAFEALARADAWRLFETHSAVKSTRAGKRYKEWLFARVAGSPDDALDVVQGGATLMMRAAAREFLRHELSPDFVVSLYAPLSVAGESSGALLDLLAADADPVVNVCLGEYEELARRHAGELAATLTRKERVALAAKRAGRSLSHPNALRAAGCRKSALADAFRHLMRRLLDDLAGRYPDEDSESVLTLAFLTFERLRDIVPAMRAGSDP